MDKATVQPELEIQQLKEEIAKLKQEETKLKETGVRRAKDNLTLRHQNIKLQENVAKFAQENTRLETDNASLRQNATPTDPRVLGLEKELKDEKQKARLTAPLVKVGVAVRLNFWEESRDGHNGYTADAARVEDENLAAQRGDFLADNALFHLGYLASDQSTAAEKVDESSKSSKEFFQHLYSVALRDFPTAHFDPPYSVCGNC